ncbi:MAG TPA: response regulator [Stellaceae bacterium]|nr:response regulator [Stellaceae bacterium]
MAVNPPRILVVDDDAAGRYVKAHTLKASGFSVAEAATGADAVCQTTRSHTDLVVLDVKLPDISGIEVCRRIKSQSPGTMVLQTSAAFVGPGHRAAGLEGGADSYLVEPIDPPELIAAVNALLRTREAEFQLRQLNQELERRVAERTSELQAANAKLQAEVVERRKAQVALQLAGKMELLGQLTGGIAHDFNNLLTVISGNLDLLFDTVSAAGPLDGSRLKKLIAAAQNGTTQAGRLTRRLLALARRDDARPLPADVGRLITGLEEFLVRALGKQVALRLSIGRGLWLCRLDQMQFEAALLNLAVNARDAMPDGGEFTISTANVRTEPNDPEAVAPGEYILIGVADTGTGMDKEVLARAFDPFFTTKQVGKGTGLGLSQVHSFVTSAGGYLKVTSAPNRGTKFDIYLPRGQEQEPTRAVASRDLPAILGGYETVLVVEDDPDVLDVVLKLLRMLGYEVITASSGPEALEVLRSGRTIDLLFTDVVMPAGLSGYELAEAAHKIDKHLKVLLTSGYSAEYRPSHNIRWPMLYKPYTSAELGAQLRAALDDSSRGRHAR